MPASCAGLAVFYRWRAVADSGSAVALKCDATRTAICGFKRCISVQADHAQSTVAPLSATLVQILARSARKHHFPGPDAWNSGLSPMEVGHLLCAAIGTTYLRLLQAGRARRPLQA